MQSHISYSKLYPLHPQCRLELLFWPTEVWVRDCGQGWVGGGIQGWCSLFQHLISLSLQLAGGRQGGAIGETKFIWRLVSSGEISLTSLWFSLAPSAGDHDWQVVSKSVVGLISLSWVQLHPHNLLWRETLQKTAAILSLGPFCWSKSPIKALWLGEMSHCLTQRLLEKPTYSTCLLPNFCVFHIKVEPYELLLNPLSHLQGPGSHPLSLNITRIITLLTLDWMRHFTVIIFCPIGPGSSSKSPGLRTL